MLTAISMCSSGRASSLAISLFCLVSTRRRWLETIIHATPPRPIFQALDLQQQAFARVAGADTGRVERLHYLERVFQNFGFVLAGRGDYFHRSRNIAVFVQVADQGFRGVAHADGNHRDTKLRP